MYNSSATKRLLVNWNIAYRALSLRGSRLADQQAFRVSLFRSGANYRELPLFAPCHDQYHLSKSTLPCPGGHADSGACIVINSRVPSIPGFPGPLSLPNFYCNRSTDPNTSTTPHPYPVLADVIYWHAPAIFLHIPKAAGNSVKRLFVKGYLKHKRTKYKRDGGSAMQSLHIDTRYDWEVKSNTRRSPAILYGAFAFGACASHSIAPCAYYVVRHISVCLSASYLIISLG